MGAAASVDYNQHERLESPQQFLHPDALSPRDTNSSVESADSSAISSYALDIMDQIESTIVSAADNFIIPGMQKMREMYDDLVGTAADSSAEDTNAFERTISNLTSMLYVDMHEHPTYNSDRDPHPNYYNRFYNGSGRSAAFQILEMWSVQHSQSESLEFSDCGKCVQRKGNHGYYPFALSSCHTLLSCVTIELETAAKKDNYLSIGFTSLDGAEITNSLGKLPSTWGIIDRRNNSQPSEIWGNGRFLARADSLVQGDRVSIYLDTRQTTNHSKNGNAVLLINGKIVYRFEEIPSEPRYRVGAVLCQGHKLRIVPVDCRSLLSSSTERREDNHEELLSDQDIPRRMNNRIIITSSDNNLSTDSGDVNDFELGRSSINDDSDLVEQNIQSDSLVDLRERAIPVPVSFPRSMNLLTPVRPQPSPSMAAATSNTNSDHQEIPWYLSESNETTENMETVVKEIPSVATEKKEPTSSSIKHEDSNLCCICMEENKCVVLLPCKHLCVCEGCGLSSENKNKSQLDRCPMCREKVNNTIKVFW